MDTMFLVQLEDEGRSAAPLACRLKTMTRLPIPRLSLDGVPAEEQELLILEDILLVMMGCEGNYIRYSSSYDPTKESNALRGPKYSLSRGLNPGLKDLTERLLKIVSSYVAIDIFCNVRSQATYGLVNHALAAAIREKLLEYFTLVGILDHRFRQPHGLTLNGLHKSVQGISSTLIYLRSITEEILRHDETTTTNADDFDAFDNIQQMIDLIRDRTPTKRICKGGAILRVLSDRLKLESGDKKTQDLTTYLFHKASKPYCKMLYRWINFGEFEDPYFEFMIRESKGIHKSLLNDDYTDEYWEKRYTFWENIPQELEDLKQKILIAGKYINVLRESDGVAPQATKEAIISEHFLDDPVIVEDVERAYAFANSSLLNHLITTHDLSARLLSLKHYFFLDHSEFFSNFLDLSMSELRKPVADVSLPRLQSLLDISLRFGGNTISDDPYKEDLKVELNETGLTEWLMDVVNVLQNEDEVNSLLEDGPNHNIERKYEGDKNLRGIAALQLDYTVPFPLSLIISKKAIIRYQILFRHILSLKHVELLLTNLWQDHMKLKAWRAMSSAPEVEKAKKRIWILRGPNARHGAAGTLLLHNRSY